MRWRVPLPIPSDAPFPSRHARVDVGGTESETVYVSTWNTPLLALFAANGTIRWAAASPCIAEEQVHPVGDKLYSLGFDGTNRYALAIEAKTGKVLWRSEPLQNFEIGHLGSEPVLIVRRSSPMRQTISVVNVTDYSHIWNKTFAGLPATFDYVHLDGIVFTATSLVDDAYPNTLVANRLSDGNTLWARTIGFYYLVAGAGAVFAFGTVTHSKAYSAVNGTLLWEFEGISVNAGTAVNNVVVFGTAKHIVAINVNA